MRRSIHIPVIGLTIAVLLAGCAQVPKEMVYAGSAPDRPPRVWPEPPEVPRLAFVGTLTGEQNFRAPAGQTASGLEKFGRWLVGLGAFSRDPMVLQRPQCGVIDANGRVLVTDVSRQGVFVFDPVEGELDVWTQAEDQSVFASPIGIAIASDGSILVADSELAQVFRLQPNGKPLGGFGRGVLKRPTGLAVDRASGRVYVADTRAHDIKVFDAAGALVDTLGAPGTRPGEFNGPTHVAFRDGLLYVADTLNARVQVLTPDGQPVSRVGRRGLYVGNITRPKGVAADSDGHVYVMEGYYDYLLVYDNNGDYLLPIGGTGSGIGEFFLPGGVWTDDRDRVYVADTFNGRIVVFQYLGD